MIACPGFPQLAPLSECSRADLSLEVASSDAAPRDDQYISLSPTESPVDDADMELGVAALGPALQAGN